MLDKLADVEARYEELNRKLAQPDTAHNQRLLTELGREHRRLSKIVAEFRRFKAISAQIDGNQEIIDGEEDAELVAMATAELRTLAAEKAALGATLRVLLLPRDVNDDKNVILEIRAGTGGDEASLFVGDLFKMYGRLAELYGWKVDILSMSPGTQGGFKELIAMLAGDEVYPTLRYESGVHRVQRVPATEAQGRIHTSAVTVAVLPEAEEVEVAIAESDLRIDVYRSSGPGGQSVNTTDSAVRITHLPTGLVVTCQNEKSQHKNRSQALQVLRARLVALRRAEQEAQLMAERRSMVKSGDRSEKIRTYNFPQDRLTDHRIGLTVHGLARIFQGSVNEVITALRTHFQAEALKGQR